MPVHQPSKRPPGRPTSNLTDSAATRQLILQTAMQLFQVHDYADVPMSSIAAAAGLTKATLYYHFSSKSEVLAAATLVSLEGVYDTIQRIFDQSDRSVRERLTQLLEARRQYIALISASQTMIHNTHGHLNAIQQDAVEKALQRTVDQFTLLMQDGIQHGELKAFDPLWLTHIFQHMMNAAASIKVSATDQRALDEMLLSVFFEGAGQK